MRKKLIYAFIAVALIGFLGTIGVSAKTGNNQADLIQKLTQRFNLNTDDVQKIFDEFQQEKRQNMQQEMENRYKERLDKMVSDGKLTQSQEDAILAKKDELQKKYEELKGLALMVDERRAKMEEINDEVKKWAEENGIDLKWINLSGGRGCKGMRGNFGGMPDGFEEGFGPGHSFGPRW